MSKYGKLLGLLAGLAVVIVFLGVLGVYAKNTKVICQDFLYKGEAKDCGLIRNRKLDMKEYGYEQDSYRFLGKMMGTEENGDKRYIWVATKTDRGVGVVVKLYLSGQDEAIIAEKRFSNNLADNSRQEYKQIMPSKLAEIIKAGDEFDFDLSVFKTEDDIKGKGDSYRARCQGVNQRIINYLTNDNLGSFLVYKLGRVVNWQCRAQINQIAYYDNN